MLDIAIRSFFALIFIGSGIYHFVNPAFYLPLMPKFLPAHKELIYLSGIVEIVVGIGLFIGSVRNLAVWGVIALLLIFTPIHIIDLFKEKPYVGTKGVAAGRLVAQFILLAAAFFIL